jgi:hypothetical protein
LAVGSRTVPRFVRRKVIDGRAAGESVDPFAA